MRVLWPLLDIHSHYVPSRISVLKFCMDTLDLSRLKGGQRGNQRKQGRQKRYQDDAVCFLQSDCFGILYSAIFHNGKLCWEHCEETITEPHSCCSFLLAAQSQPFTLVPPCYSDASCSRMPHRATETVFITTHTPDSRTSKPLQITYAELSLAFHLAFLGPCGRWDSEAQLLEVTAYCFRLVGLFHLLTPSQNSWLSLFSWNRPGQILSRFYSTVCCSSNHYGRSYWNLPSQEANFLRFFYPFTTNCLNLRLQKKRSLEDICKSLYSFLRAALTKCNKPGSFQQKKYIVSQFWSLKVWNQDISRAMLPP